MVISLSLVKRKKNNGFGLNILFTLFFCDLKLIVIYAFFRKSEFPKFQSSPKNGFFQVWVHMRLVDMSLINSNLFHLSLVHIILVNMRSVNKSLIHSSLVYLSFLQITSIHMAFVEIMVSPPLHTLDERIEEEGKQSLFYKLCFDLICGLGYRFHKTTLCDS